jgi:hypothetical protein
MTRSLLTDVAKNGPLPGGGSSLATDPVAAAHASTSSPGKRPIDRATASRFRGSVHLHSLQDGQGKRPSMVRRPGTCPITRQPSAALSRASPDDGTEGCRQSSLKITAVNAAETPAGQRVYSKIPRAPHQRPASRQFAGIPRSRLGDRGASRGETEATGWWGDTTARGD